MTCNSGRKGWSDGALASLELASMLLAAGVVLGVMLTFVLWQIWAF